MSDVFISYKRENLPAVNWLVEALRAEGIGVWWDQDIPPNAAWEATIERELVAAKLVIVAWSPSAVASENVKAEARWARQQGRLLQVFVEACDPPLFFGERQGVDLKNWSGAASDPAFRSVLDAVRKGPAPASATQDPSVVYPAANAPLALPTKPSIAVMPFANLSGDPEQEYFADGMVAEITNALSRFRSLFVIASSSTLTFKGKVVGAQDAARRLGVRHVLEGSVRKAANRVRIAVQLIDGNDGAQIWSQRFDDTLEDVFALQDKVALAVAGVIAPTVRHAEIRRASERPTDNPTSYDLYLRALSNSIVTTAAPLEEALDLLNRAIALDPNYGPALSRAAMGYRNRYQFGWADNPDHDRRQAVDLANRALAVARDDADVLANVASVLGRLGGDRGAVVALLDRALALNPGSSSAWFSSGRLRVNLGDSELGAEQIETSMRLDPLSPLRPSQVQNLGLARFVQGRFDEALALAQEATHLRPESWTFQFVLAACLGQVGHGEAARKALARAHHLNPRFDIRTAAEHTLYDIAQRQQLLDALARASPADPV